MKANAKYIHPAYRLSIALALFLSILISSSTIQLIITCLISVLIIGYLGYIKEYMRFILISGLPFLIVLLVIYGLVLEDNNHAELIQAIFTFFRIISLAALFLLTFKLTTVEIIDLFRYFKIKGYIGLIILESYLIVNELGKKVNLIYTARLSRGFLKNRTMLERIKQFPYLMRPLISSLLIGSFEKASHWKQIKMFDQFFSWVSIDKGLILMYPTVKNMVITSIIFTWLLIIIIQ